MANYQRVTLDPAANVGDPGPLPSELIGLADSSLADLEAAIGTPAATELGYLNTGFLPLTEAVVGTTVSNTQLRLALLDASLLDDVDLAVTSLPEDDQIRWQYNNVFNVNQPMIVAAFLAAVPPIDQAQREAIFDLAATLPN